MSINVTNFGKLNELISLSLKRRPKIVLNPAEEYCIKTKRGMEDISANIVFDKKEWKISQQIKTFVDELAKDNKLNDEDKILLLYEKLCKEYIYDDNVLSYIKKNDDDKFALPDWYGRDNGAFWDNNREKHNRRVCYEVSRYLAKAITELFKGKNSKNHNVCILWDVYLTHYFVGLTCDEYTITLDLDDFNNIKDLTRIKTDLTAEGIVILDDKSGKFKSALDKFNEGKNPYAIKKIDNQIDSTYILNDKMENEDMDVVEEPDDIIFLKNAIEILKHNYDIDSQGLFEYIKEIVDIKLGSDSRKKVWKKINGNSGKNTRYTRCLVINVDDEEYIIDVDKKELRHFDKKEFEKEDAEFIPFKALSRDWDERYDGI